MSKPELPREGHYDTIRRLIGAAQKRFREAEFLAASRYNTIAVYLFSYSAEMLIKSACFRLEGYGPSDQIERKDRGRVAEAARAHGLPAIGPHDLLGWARLLFEIKSHRSPGADRGSLRRIVFNAQAISEHWHTELRYEPTDISPQALTKVQDAAQWIRANYERMIKD